MDGNAFFAALWEDFARMAPQAADIRRRLVAHGERVSNDHVAFRTFDGPEVGLETLEPRVLGLGYQLLEEYRFESKHLRARAYVRAGHPRIFLSELIRAELGSGAQRLLARLLEHVPAHFAQSPDALFSGRPWPPLSHGEYQQLSDESEYAGWVAALGFRANHFTVSVNALRKLRDVQDVLRFVEDAGYRINDSGGRVKGTPSQRLEQGSTLADRMPIDFADGRHEIPTGYYEFALRHVDDAGVLYDGFVPASAHHIFDSTTRS